MAFLPRHLLGHLIREPNTKSHEYVCEGLVIFQRILMRDLVPINAVLRDPAMARRVVDLALMVMIQCVYRLWDEAETVPPYPVTFRYASRCVIALHLCSLYVVAFAYLFVRFASCSMLHVTMTIVRHLVRAEFVPVIRPRAERVFVEAMVRCPATAIALRIVSSRVTRWSLTPFILLFS